MHWARACKGNCTSDIRGGSWPSKLHSAHVRNIPPQHCTRASAPETCGWAPHGTDQRGALEQALAKVKHCKLGHAGELRGQGGRVLLVVGAAVEAPVSVPSPVHRARTSPHHALMRPTSRKSDEHGIVSRPPLGVHKMPHPLATDARYMAPIAMDLRRTRCRTNSSNPQCAPHRR